MRILLADDHELVLDGFKAVNDTHGHGVGDQVLQVVAARLAEYLGAGCPLARLGGDEFAIVWPGRASPQGARAGARAMLVAFDTPFDVGRRPFRSAADRGCD